MRKLIGILTIVLFIGSCAKEAPNPLEGKDFEAYTKWVEKNAPGAKLYKEGIYYEIIENTSVITPTEVKDTSWININYTSRKLDGMVFLTRNEQVSRHVGKWNKRTHWCDDFVNMYYPRTTLPIGLHALILDGKIQEGDSARVYLPSQYGYNLATGINEGYKGESTTYAAVPVYVDLRLSKIIRKASTEEKNAVDDFVKAQSLIKYRLLRFDEGLLYYGITEPHPTNDTIADGDLVDIDITEYFLDEFIIATNNSSIALEKDIFEESALYNPMTLAVGSKNEEYKVFLEIVQHMRYGESANIVCTSNWTKEGIAGTPESIPQINPYTPRIYKIRIHPKESTAD